MSKSYRKNFFLSAIILSLLLLGFALSTDYLLSYYLLRGQELEAAEDHLQALSRHVHASLRQAYGDLQLTGWDSGWSEDVHAVLESHSTYDRMTALNQLQTRMRIRMATQDSLDALYLRFDDYLITETAILRLSTAESDSLDTSSETLSDPYRTLLARRRLLPSDDAPEGLFVFRSEQDYDLIGAVDIASLTAAADASVFLFLNNRILVSPSGVPAEQIAAAMDSSSFVYDSARYYLAMFREESTALIYASAHPVSAIHGYLKTPILITAAISLGLFSLYLLFIFIRLKHIFSPIEILQNCLTAVQNPDDPDALTSFAGTIRHRPAIATSLHRLYMLANIPLILVMITAFLQFQTAITEQSVQFHLQTLKQVHTLQTQRLTSYLQLAREIAFGPEVQDALIWTKLYEAPHVPSMDKYLRQALSYGNVQCIRLYDSQQHLLYDSSPATRLPALPEHSAFTGENAALIWTFETDTDDQIAVTLRIHYLQETRNLMPYFSVIGYVQLGLEQSTVLESNSLLLQTPITCYLLDTEAEYIGAEPQKGNAALIESAFSSENGRYQILTRGLNRWLAASFPAEKTPFSLGYLIELDHLLLNSFLPLYLSLLLSSTLLLRFISYLSQKQLMYPVLQLEAYTRTGDAQTAHGLLPHHNEIYQLAEKFSEMLRRQILLKDDLLQNEITLRELDRRRQEAEFTALHRQVDPHFLHNILLSINMLIRGGELPQASATTELLGRYLRRLLGSRKILPLADELDAVSLYLEIQKIRFGSRLTFHIEKQDQSDGIELPHFLIQPLVENALIHGIDPIRPLHIRITACREADFLIIRVEDNGRGTDETKLEELRKLLNAGEPSEEHIGLRNVNERIQIYYGTEYGLTLEGYTGYFCSILKLPYERR